MSMLKSNLRIIILFKGIRIQFVNLVVLKSDLILQISKILQKIVKIAISSSHFIRLPENLKWLNLRTLLSQSITRMVG